MASFRNFTIFLTAICMILQAGCFRYTPSRQEMIEEQGSSKVKGRDAFEAYQAGLRERLESLIIRRSKMIEQGTGIYQIGVRDIIDVDVFGFTDVSGKVAVSERGTISLPLVGDVIALGKSNAELQSELTDRFRRFIKNPIVRVTVEGVNAHRVSVVGAVVRPGWYPLERPGYLLTELLADVGGTKDNSGSRVFLIPGVDDPQAALEGGKGRGVEINMEELTGTLDRPPLMIPLMPGDTVIIPEAGQFRVDGEVTKPGSFAVTRSTSALSAIAAAGGFTYAANVNEVEVIRDIGNGLKASKTIDLEQVAFNGAQDLELRDGDVVLVPSAPGRFRARQVVEAFTSVFRGGVSGSVRY